MPILAATSIGSLSIPAQAIWRAQQGISRRTILIVREDEFNAVATTNGGAQSVDLFYGQSWRNTSIIASDTMFDINDDPATFSNSLWLFVAQKLQDNPTINYIAYDFPSITGMILDGNFVDERDPVNNPGINIIDKFFGVNILALKTYLLGSGSTVGRDIKIGMIGIPAISRWTSSNGGASYQRISERTPADISNEISARFFSPAAGSKWQSVVNMMNALDFITLDGRDFSSWNSDPNSNEHLDYVKYMSVLAQSFPAPSGPVGTEKEILCLIGDHEFVPPFRRALFPTKIKDFRIRTGLGVKPQFRDPPPAEHRSFVNFDFSSTRSVNRFSVSAGQNVQVRAGSFGISSPATFTNWREFVENNIRPWYIWGQRRFWLHLPFGSPNQTGVPGSFNAPEAGTNQMDAWMAAKHGQTLSGVLVNNPMPWLTEDFVGTWHYMTTGTALSSSSDVYDLGRHQETNPTWMATTDEVWFDPLDPIEVVGYSGSPASHIASSNPDAIDRINAMDPERFQILINDCYEPFLWSGMSIGFDKASSGPQSWPGKSVATSQLNGHYCGCTRTSNFNKCYIKDTLQAVWYRWLADLGRRHPKRIYLGGTPRKERVVDPLLPAT